MHATKKQSYSVENGGSHIIGGSRLKAFVEFLLIPDHSLVSSFWFWSFSISKGPWIAIHFCRRVQEFRMDEKDKESGEMANLVPKAFVPLNTKLGRIKHIPKGPFHSKFKQVSQCEWNLDVGRAHWEKACWFYVGLPLFHCFSILNATSQLCERSRRLVCYAKLKFNAERSFMSFIWKLC